VVLYSAWWCLYIAETCSWLLVIDKDMFGLWVYILVHLHVYLNTKEMTCLKIMNCWMLSPGQINSTNRNTVLTEKLRHETGDVPECAIQLCARNAGHLMRHDCTPSCYLANATNYKAPEHVHTRRSYFTMFLFTIRIQILPTGDNISTRTIKILVTLLLCVI
jgi:hypothetical protein